MPEEHTTEADVNVATGTIRAMVRASKSVFGEITRLSERELIFAGVVFFFLWVIPNSVYALFAQVLAYPDISEGLRAWLVIGGVVVLLVMAVCASWLSVAYIRSRTEVKKAEKSGGTG